MALRPVRVRNWSREAIAARLGRMLLARVERDAEAPAEWEFTLAGKTYRVAVRVAGQEQ